MKRLTTGLFLLFLANSVGLGQPIHKNARVHIQTMPENFDSAIRSEIIKRRIPIRIVEVPAEAELIMKENSGFNGTQRHRQGIRLIIEVFDPAGSRRWPGAPGARFYWIENASPGWQSEIAERVVEKLSRGVQRYPSTASSTEDWWPWAKEKREERADATEVETKPEQTAGETEESALASRASTYRTPPSEVNVSWEEEDNTQVAISFSRLPLEIKTGMKEEEVRDLFGNPLKIASLDDKTIYKYRDMVVEFRDGKVFDIKFH